MSPSISASVFDVCVCPLQVSSSPQLKTLSNYRIQNHLCVKLQKNEAHHELKCLLLDSDIGFIVFL